MKKQAGFTLIELIMVIVILGILSAFALPRFADLSDSAETASLEGALASMKSSSAIVHASALANTATGATGEIEMESDFFALVHGYPDAGGIVAANGSTTNGFGLAEAAGVDTDYTIVYDSTATTLAAQIASDSLILTIQPIAADVECVAYQEPQGANQVPTIIKSVINAAANACGTVNF